MTNPSGRATPCIPDAGVRLTFPARVEVGGSSVFNAYKQLRRATTSHNSIYPIQVVHQRMLLCLFCQCCSRPAGRWHAYRRYRPCKVKKHICILFLRMISPGIVYISANCGHPRHSSGLTTEPWAVHLQGGTCFYTLDTSKCGAAELGSASLMHNLCRKGSNLGVSLHRSHYLAAHARSMASCGSTSKYE